MQAKLYYLPFDGQQTKQIRSKIGYDDNFELTQSQFETHWEHEANDEIPVSETEEVLTRLWPRWNRGSGQECSEFMKLSCKGCDKTFPNHLKADNHAKDNAGHEITGHRSLSVGDVAVVDGEAFLCARMGWDKVDVDPEVVTA